MELLGPTKQGYFGGDTFLQAILIIGLGSDNSFIERGIK